MSRASERQKKDLTRRGRRAEEKRYEAVLESKRSVRRNLLEAAAATTLYERGEITNEALLEKTGGDYVENLKRLEFYQRAYKVLDLRLQRLQGLLTAEEYQYITRGVLDYV